MNIGSFDLIKELGAENFSQENKEELLKNYSTVLEKRISDRLMSELSEEQLKEMSALIEDKKTKEADQYLLDNIEDIEFIVRDEVRKFKKHIQEKRKNMQEALKKYKEQTNESVDIDL